MAAKVVALAALVETAREDEAVAAAVEKAVAVMVVVMAGAA